MDQHRGGYSSAKSGSEEMVLEGNCDQGWQLKVVSAGFGGLSLGKVSRWMDTQGGTIISEELVHMGGLGYFKASFLSEDVVEQTRLKIC